MKNLSMKMKGILLAGFLMFSIGLQAQMLTVGETEKLYDEAEQLEKTANNLLTEFILMQQAEKYDIATQKYNSADSIYKILLTRGTEPENLAGIMGTLIEANQLIISTTLMLVKKEEIMAEKPEDRKQKVKYNGQTYKLTKESKSYFEMLNPKK